jgi:uncharacterized membrane protein YdjX (TVP38/TMEM64 family)
MSDRDFRDYAVAAASGTLIGLVVVFGGQFSTRGIGWPHVLCGCIATAIAVASRLKRRQPN